jgi:ABC-type lipoprotein release transport system permease subunit
MVSCVAIGTLIGVFTAIALTLQFNIFTEMPFAFTFPTGLYMMITISSTMIALAGAYFPAMSYCNLKIAIALKGGGFK